MSIQKLRKKYYNEGIENLTKLEKTLLIFVEQMKDKLRKIIKNDEIEGVIKIMDKIKLDTKLPTYDKEEYVRLERISFEKKKKKFNKDLEKFENLKEEVNQIQKEVSQKQEDLKKTQEEFNKNQEEFNETKNR